MYCAREGVNARRLHIPEDSTSGRHGHACDKAGHRGDSPSAGHRSGLGGGLAAYAQGQGVKPDPSRSSYLSVNEEDFRAVFRRMWAAKAEVMKRQMDLLNARYDLGERPAHGVTMCRGKADPGRRSRQATRGATWDALAT